MENNTNPNKEELLIPYFRNQLTDKERIELENWIQNSPDNFQIAREYFYLSVAGSALLSSRKTPPEEALKKINKQIRKKHFHFYITRIQRIAAVLLIPLILFSGYLILDSGYLSKEPSNNKTISYIETRMAPGMTGSLVLPDGTKVWLNSSTYLKYPASFTEDLREVTIDGEAFFRVEKNKEKRFIVHTPQSSITVLGTDWHGTLF